MGQRYHHLAFGAETLARQRAVGSITAYGADLTAPIAAPQELDSREIALIKSVFQFQMATVTPAGWPYIQYRSGPPGFLHHLGGSRIGFADFHGNQQFVSVGNIDSNGKVALFLADYPLKQRLKVFGHATVVDAADDPELLARLRKIGNAEIAARCERSIVIDVEAFDWNCSRSLIPQYRREEVQALNQRHADEIARLRAELDEARTQLAARQDG
ncbi:pyridoxamine 5'-phosphate oxidase family protein [Nocardia jejuensis]|uniref:pyridoxamine 5'-phosphate oxidase family protein n=1 Tax=Nocardia jejuensis TaxID=328049 RepID=UPI00082C448C|nr:pyridoxamine 5'-phosphate oxidase family protein [Nocardia jejuensis]